MTGPAPGQPIVLGSGQPSRSGQPSAAGVGDTGRFGGVRLGRSSAVPGDIVISDGDVGAEGDDGPEGDDAAREAPRPDGHSGAPLGTGGSGPTGAGTSSSAGAGDVGGSSASTGAGGGTGAGHRCHRRRLAAATTSAAPITAIVPFVNGTVVSIS
jgi:hypothetical protein